MTKYSSLLDEAVNLTSSNKGFRTVTFMVATYEQILTRLSYFYPKRRVHDDDVLL